MRELRFVTRTEDGAILVEQPDGFERFRLSVDDGLRAAVAGSLPLVTGDGGAPTAPTPAQRPAPTAPTAQPDPIGPREIQVRVRSGESPQSLADEHGLPVERILRFAAPVMAERRRITDEARRARARRTGYDESEPRVVQFGEAVDERYAAHGVDIEQVTWDSRRREDGEWIVTASWTNGSVNGSANAFAAQWLFHRASRSVTPLDDTAADLLSDRPIRPVVRAEPETPHVTAPPLVPGVIAFPPFPDAHTGPIQRIEEVFDQEDTRDLPRRVPPFAATSALSEEPLAFDEPPLPLAISDGEGRPVAASPLRAVSRGESDDEKAARARIPSWDDILLGVRRKED